MSQVGRKGCAHHCAPVLRTDRTGTFKGVAGFRIGRGRDNRTQQQQPRQAPPPHQGGGGQPPYARQPQQPPQWPQGAGPQGRQPQYGEPEYFGDPHHGGQHGGPPQHDPYANSAGHTRAFSIDDPYGDGATYQAGNAPAPPAGPRLHWKQLLSGIVLRPKATFWQMRDYAVWGPALVVTFVYGLLAIFGFDKAREETINATLSSAVPYVLTTGVALVIAGFILGAVTHTLARQLGGTGAWQPTVGLSMLIMSITDAPRLLFALFLGGENSLVQLLGWATWLGAGALFTLMVSRSHDLPWPKALGAASIQLIALLSIIKLGTL
ncbi:Yip1 family protein [Streptomyces sp. NPDC059256]|uniref:Yip1 family protein n=1 Tax=Streptomyces sp. NPDC059256 TaxID=3346794 RepID=UPI0036A5C2C5